MRRLSELLGELTDFGLVGPANQPVRKLEFWLDEVGPDDVFVAISGHPIDGHDVIGEAVTRGARTVLCERLPAERAAGVTFVVVPDSIKAMGRLAHAFHGHPTRTLKVVGVTGTNGKTTTAALLHRLFRRLGHGAGLLSNIGDYVNDAGSEPRYTTGHALFLGEQMARMVEAGCGYAFMEVSSQGVVERRLEGVRFAGAIFTNLTRDHLNYHGTMEAYAAAKKAWFDALPPEAFALTNLDDPRGAWMAGDTRARTITYGTGPASDLRLQILSETLAGLDLKIGAQQLASPLLGAFNAYNLAAVFGTATALGEAPGKVAAALASLRPVEGRMQAIRATDARVAIVDYAHTPDAVEKVLSHLSAARPDGARIITVIGCGGGGDTGRRPILAATAAALSDRLILTSDNPRSEDPEAIVADMLKGLDRDGLARTETVADRRAAIQMACEAARPGDIVLIAGKGHERYQEIAGVRHPFDDHEVARAALGLAP